MNGDDAERYLAGRLQKVYDALGNKSRPNWSLTDATAVRALLSERSLRANGSSSDRARALASELDKE